MCFFVNRLIIKFVNLFFIDILGFIVFLMCIVNFFKFVWGFLLVVIFWFMKLGFFIVVVVEDLLILVLVDFFSWDRLKNWCVMVMMFGLSF